MKLSENTMNILKNFSTINQSLQFKNGNVLKTVSPLKTIYVEATIDESLPKDFALYDLNKLLAKISLYKEADLSFGADRLNIATDNKKKSDYIKYCSPQVIVAPKDGKSITLDDPFCSFSLSKEDFDWMRRSAGISGSPHFVFESDGKTVTLMATDVVDDSSDQSKIDLGDGDGKAFKVVMKVDNIKMMDGSYDISIAKKGLAKFVHKNLPVVYYIAIEAKDSNFSEE